MRHLFLAGLLLVAPTPLLAQFRLPIPRIPGLPTEVPLPPVPGLDELMREQPPVSTSLENAVTEIPLMDDYNPQQAAPMTQLRRGENGSFILTPGVYEYDAQSYCLHAGTYAPSGGDGYLYAPLEGKRGEIIRHILQNSVDHPQIAQRDIQVLIWAILARTKFDDLSDELQAVARQLLSEDEIDDLNGGVLGLIPPEVQTELFSRLPSQVRQVLQAEANLRSLLTQGNASYNQLEQIAVLTGNAGVGEGSREVPGGRWSLHPGGFFIRYIPSGYSRTKVQVSLPDRYTITRDAQGRITAIADTQGNRTETLYDDSIPPRTHERDPNLRAYAFRTIRLIRPTANGQTEQFEIQNRGWTFVDHPNSSASLPTAPVQVAALPGIRLAQADRFGEWARRSQEAYDQQQEIQDFWERIERNTDDPSEEDLNDLTDLEHYQDGLDAALEGSEGDRLDWIAQHQERQRNALEYAICVLEERCNAGGTVEFDPSGDVAVPGNTSRQRLGQSARSW